MTTADIKTPRPYPGIRQAKIPVAKTETLTTKPSADIASIRKGDSAKGFRTASQAYRFTAGTTSQEIGALPENDSSAYCRGQKETQS